MSALQVAEIMAEVITSYGHEAMVCPLADGGEGTSELLTRSCNGRPHRLLVGDPLGRKVSAQFGTTSDGTTAFIDMSQAAGLFRLAPEERDPERSSTFGVGEMIAHALGMGAAEIIIGCGGSATNDGATGMAAALGYRFMDEFGRVIIPSGGSLHEIVAIDDAHVLPSIKSCRFTVISDVINPFTGPEGAAAVFAPQKGADENAVRRLEAGMRNLQSLFEARSGFRLAQVRGAGAGGGFTGGAAYFLNAGSQPGSQWVMERTGFMQLLENADMVVTGEGSLDTQSLSGKVAGTVGLVCRNRKIPFAVVCGQNRLEGRQRSEFGASRIVSLSGVAGSVAAALEAPVPWLRETVTDLIRGLN